MAHAFIRPPKDAKDVMRLSQNGRWHKDNGEPARAFSGALNRFFPDLDSYNDLPCAWFAVCDCGPHPPANCPAERAMDLTARRFGAANGYSVQPKRSKKR